MKLVKGIVATVAALVLLFVVIGMLLPREVEVERSIVIDAPAEDVFQLVNDFRSFNRWSPWFRADPDADYRYGGADAGVGARMEWESEELGSGAQEIVASEPWNLVRTELDFGEQGSATAEFRLRDEDGATHVTWWFHADFGNNPASRWVGLFFESFIGPDYEQGLANLKELAEATNP